MAGLRPPFVPDQPVPVFNGDDLARLERACAGRSFQQRRDAAVIAMFRATGMRLSELAGIRYDSADLSRCDLDLWHREITVHGKGRKTRTVKISHDAARGLDRYIRARHAQAHRPQLWLGIGNRGPMTASGIYQVIVRRRRECGIEVFPHRFRHHFSHTWLDRGRPHGAQRLEFPADAAPLRGQRPQRTSPPQLRPRHGRRAVIRPRHQPGRSAAKQTLRNVTAGLMTTTRDPPARLNCRYSRAFVPRIPGSSACQPQEPGVT